MNRCVLTIPEVCLLEAHQYFQLQDGKEAAGYLYCGHSNIGTDPWTGAASEKYHVRHFTPVLKAAVISSSRGHITWDTADFVRSLRRAREQEEVLAIVHSHPAGFDRFSAQDDRNEADLAALARKRNGSATALISIVILPDGRVFGRVWKDIKNPSPIDLVISSGRRMALHYPERGGGEDRRFLNRQALALGPAFNEDLSQLRFGIVGCGGTGSAVGMLLPRLGSKYVALFDDDVVDETNLNRLHFSTRSDARASRPKVEVIKRGIEQMELGTKVRSFRGWVNDPESRAALKACDVIFGCTDDNAGRILLNRFAYFYNTPVIDMGLAIDVGPGDSPKVRAFDGRVTVLQPGATCLLCRGVVDLAQAHAEALKRANPEEYARQKEEAYVVGEKNPSPAVVSFTTAVAAMAVEELIHRLQGFRGDVSVDQRLRRFHLITDRRQGEEPYEHCPICASSEYWGRADIEPFLDSA